MNFFLYIFYLFDHLNIFYRAKHEYKMYQPNCDNKGSILEGGFLMHTTHRPILLFMSPALSVWGTGFLNILFRSIVAIQ